MNYDKQVSLRKIINTISEKKIFYNLNDADYLKEKERISNDINMYTDKIYSDRCIYDNKKKKIIIKNSASKNMKNLIEKIVWNFIELLIINKDINIISSILQNNIDKGDLYKSEKNDEIFFNYLEYNNGKIDDIFKYKSKYIRDINFMI